MLFRNSLAIFVTMTTILLLPVQSVNASVSSLSRETFKEAPNRRWVVSINCESSTEPQLISRPLDSGQWCTNESPQTCSSDKLALAKRLCEDVAAKASVAGQTAYPSAVATTAKPTTPLDVASPDTASVSQSTQIDAKNRGELLQEKIQIEEQRIQVQQRKLELQRKELELKKSQISNS